MVVAGAVITGAPIGPAPQLLQPQPSTAGASPQGEHSLRRPKQPPAPPHGFPSPQQPNDTLVRAANVVKISSLFMAGLSSTRQNRNKAISGVGQLYNMPSDVQTQRAGIFFATGL